MSSKFYHGIFIPIHPEKLLSNKKITYRSSWEFNFMKFLDTHNSVLNWMSEGIEIPYFCPITQTIHNYIPDFVVVYKDRDGKQIVEMIEIKPYKETGAKKSKSERTQMIVARNLAKWEQAKSFCEQRGMSFRVLTENELWQTKGKK